MADAAHSSTIFSAPPMANVLITAVSVVCVAGKCGGCFAAAVGRNNDAGNPAFDSRLSTIVMRYFSVHFTAHFTAIPASRTTLPQRVISLAM